MYVTSFSQNMSKVSFWRAKTPPISGVSPLHLYTTESTTPPREKLFLGAFGQVVRALVLVGGAVGFVAGGATGVPLAFVAFAGVLIFT